MFYPAFSFSADRIKPHHVPAESYQVTWWPKDADADINSQQTKEDHLLISGLKACTNYNVVVESRRMQSYADIQGNVESCFF